MSRDLAGLKASELVDLGSFRVERRGLVDGAYEVLKGMILDQVLLPGHYLNIDRLAPQLGISQTPVREALTRLLAEGMVVKQAHGGRHVVAPMLDEAGFENLFEVRLLIEPRAAAMAAKTRTDEQLVRMKEAGAAMRTVKSGSLYREYREFAVHDALLHKAIAEASGNVLLAEVIVRLRSHHQAARLYRRHGVDAEYAMPEHDAIIDAIARRDSVAAQRAMRVHLDGSRMRLRKFLARSQEE